VTGRCPRVASFPFGGCESSTDARRLLPAARASPHAVTFSLSELPCATSSGLLVTRSLPVLAGSSVAFRPRAFGSVDPQPAEPRGLPRRAARRAPACHHVPRAAFALGVAPAPGYDRRARSRATAPEARGSSITRDPPRVSPPTALAARRVYVTGPGFPHPVRSASRDSHPPDGLLHDPPYGLVSSRWRSWGSTLQSVTTRGAVTPLDVRCPPDVRDTDPPTAPRSAEACARPRAQRTQSQQGTVEADAVRLQGVQLPSGARSRRAAV
jgi:hypothetical protein